MEDNFVTKFFRIIKLFCFSYKQVFSEPMSICSSVATSYTLMFVLELLYPFTDCIMCFSSAFHVVRVISSVLPTLTTQS